MKVYELEYSFFKKIRESKGRYMRARIKGQITPVKILRVFGIIFVFTSILFSSPQPAVVEPSPTQGFKPSSFQEVKAQTEETTADKMVGPVKLADSPEVPEITAKAVLILDKKTGAVLYERNADEPLPIASLTKVMTALLSIESFSLDEKVTVPGHCPEQWGNSLGLFAGEELAVSDLLYGVLLLSASDATCALANYKTEVQDFVAAMNLKAQSLGLKRTRFSNPIGLDEDNHFSSAQDLGRLALKAMESEIFRQYVRMKEVEVRGRHLENTNQLLGAVTGVDGIKTGYTEKAGECLLISVGRGGNEIIIVLLGSGERFADAEKLIDWVYRVYKW